MDDFNRSIQIPLDDESPESKEAACAEAIENVRGWLLAEGLDPDEYDIFVTDTEVVEDVD